MRTSAALALAAALLLSPTAAHADDDDPTYCVEADGQTVACVDVP